MTSLY